MSPANKFHVDHDQHARKEINGPRPSPLKINKASPFIQKSSSTSSSSNSSSISASVAATMPSSNQSRLGEASRQQQRHGPVIIYTHSPKIIHTQARDFMALVQKLTGLSRSSIDETKPPPTTSYNYLPEKDDANESSSALTDDNCGGGGGGGDVNHVTSSASAKSSMISKSSSPCFADIPMFTPTSNELFCSPMPYFRYSTDTVFASPNMGSSISPSLMEFMKGLREYGE